MVKKQNGQAHIRAAKIERKRGANIRGFVSVGGFVETVSGDGPYAVEYGVYDCTGHIRNVDVPASNRWANLHRIKRFKTLRGATTFYDGKYRQNCFAVVYMWKNRNAQRVTEGFPSTWGPRYPGLQLMYGQSDRFSFGKNHTKSDGTYYYCDLEDDIARKLK